MAITNHIVPLLTPHTHALKIEVDNDYSTGALDQFKLWCADLGIDYDLTPSDFPFTNTTVINVWTRYQFDTSDSFYDNSYSYLNKFVHNGTSSMGPVASVAPVDAAVAANSVTTNFDLYGSFPYNQPLAWMIGVKSDQIYNGNITTRVHEENCRYYTDPTTGVSILYMHTDRQFAYRPMYFAAWIEKNNIQVIFDATDMDPIFEQTISILQNDNTPNVTFVQDLSFINRSTNPIAKVTIFETEYEVSGKILEDLSVTKWDLFINDESTSLPRRKEVIDTSLSNDFSLKFPSNNPVYMTAKVKALMWKPGINYAQNDVVYPTAPIDKPYYYRCEVAGTSSSSEPVWPTTQNATIADNTITWRRIDRLVQPQMQGPIIPLEVLT